MLERLGKGCYNPQQCCMQGPGCHGSGDAKREHSAMGSRADLHAVHARNSQMQDLLEYLETGREALAQDSSHCSMRK